MSYKITNKHKLPEALVEAIKNDPYDDSETGDISTTKLISPVQQQALIRRYKDKIVKDVVDLIWSLLGQAMHVVLERGADKNVLAEKRFASEVNGWKITGQIDLLDKYGTLWDYKLTSINNVLNGVKEEYVKQENVNRWLLYKNGVEVNKLKILAVLKDWNPIKATFSKGCPKIPLVVLEVPLWSIEDTERYITERVLLHQNAERLSDEELPECSDKERWVNYKGYSMRCKHYCDAFQFCQQKNRIKV